LVATYIGSKSAGYGYNSGDGKIYNDGVLTTYGDSYAATDIIGIAVDLDNSKLYVSKNGTWQNSGDPTSGATGTGAFSIVSQSSYYFGQGPSTCTTTANFGSDSSFAGEVTAGGNADGNGVGDFYYTPPSGYLALCTSNLSAPEIKLPGDNFNTVLWTGDGAASRSITGTGFQADMMWSKIRNSGHQHNVVDRVRGVDKKLLMPNSSDAEDTDPTHGWFDSLDSDGFTITGAGGDWNVNTDTYLYVGWNWLGAASNADNTDGDIASTVRANTTAGFSIVKYEGSGTGGDTVGHGLSVAPALIITKNIDAAYNWSVSPFPGKTSFGYALYLDGTFAETGEAGTMSAVSASTFTLYSDSHLNNNSGTDYISYCWHSIEGYSKVGSYEGNGDADGTFMYTGFRVSWLLVKRIDGVESWAIEDNKRSTYNVIDDVLFPDTNAAEQENSINNVDFVSNGFKVRNTDSRWNNSSGEYLYLAYAKSPFKYANAR
jgi:hypothetical protein